MYDEKSMQEDKGILTGLLALMLVAGLAAVTAVLYLLVTNEHLFVRLATIVLLALAVAAVIAMAATWYRSWCFTRARETQRPQAGW